MKPNIRLWVLVFLWGLLTACVRPVEVTTQPERQNDAVAPSDSTDNCIDVYRNETFIGTFTPASLTQLEQDSFIEAEQGTEQTGWYLAEVLLAQVGTEVIAGNTQIIVSSRVRQQSITLHWSDIADKNNKVLLVVTNRGTFRLASLLEQLDSRKEWVADVDRIEISSP